MKHLFLALIIGFIGFIGFTLVANDAEARRFGGGRSVGRTAPLFQKQQTAPRAAPQQRNQNNPAGASRWLGPLGGLLAGGLLAALFFGGAFEGFQFMDFIIILALVFGAVWLFKSLRGKTQPVARQVHASAGAGSGPQPRSFETPEIGSGLRDGGNHNSAGLEVGESDYRPAWFNESEFLNAAKAHFIRLQAAWDVGDMKDIREYTTPELFAELTLERQSYQGEKQFTEVVELDAEVIGMAEEDDNTVASVRYSGMIREQQDAPAHPFSEVWHIQRARDGSDNNWYVAGIQQENS